MSVCLSVCDILDLLDIEILTILLHLYLLSGLHYHLTEDQVLELLQAFGKVKAFHLVKNEPDSLTSKGYCFVEYADPSVTQVAVIGLNGMDLGGGKILTARVAGERNGAAATTPTAAAASAAAFSMAMPPSQQVGGAGAPPPNAIIIGGYDVEALVDAAMGLKPMPTAPMHVDQFGMPITRTSNLVPVPTNPVAMAAAMAAPPPATQNMNGGGAALPQGSSALDIANAALDAAFGAGAAIGGVSAAAPVTASVLPPPPPAQSPTRILVLHNMVSDEDLATDDEYFGLQEEVQEECAKFGKLLTMKIPRAPTGTVQPSALRKIFLEYATPQDATNAERELAGRQFGPNVVQVRKTSSISCCCCSPARRDKRLTHFFLYHFRRVTSQKVITCRKTFHSECSRSLWWSYKNLICLLFHALKFR